MTSSTPVVTIKNVTKKFRNKVALDDVSFEIPKGSVFAILGENGAGKTTLIRSILGLEVPKGRIEVLGMKPSKNGLKIRRQIGYVADKPALYPWMTVNEIGWFASGFYPEGYLDEYQKLVEQVELSPSQKIKNLSRGMQAKVNLSLAMAHRPDFLILDEPTSGLDTVVRRRFLESMIDIAAEGRTVLLASHQINEVERVADYVAIIHEGKVKVVERLESLKARLEWWTVLLEPSVQAVPGMGLKVLLEEGYGRQQKLLVESATTDQLCELREHPAVSAVDVDVPSLEEIFVSFVKGGMNDNASAQVMNQHDRGVKESTKVEGV